jgi:DNA-binding winged helix-turn-helix (wHTH) protein/tetratricopeptide (TPR) repeat protein
MDRAAEKIRLPSEDGMARLKCYRFGDYSFAPERLELSKSGQPTALKLQPARLLKILLENAPETVFRRTLQEKIWDNGTTVEFEQGLNVCVNQLRIILEDSASNPKYIATLPKRGYRFMAPVEAEYRTASRRKYGLAALFTAIVAIAFGAAWYVTLGTQPAVSPRIYVAPIEFVDAQSNTPASLVQYGLRLGVVDQLTRGAGTDVLTVNGETLWADEQLLRLDDKTDYRLVIKVTSDNDAHRANAMLLKEGEDNARAEQWFDIGAIDAESLSHASLEIARWAAEFLGSSLPAGETTSLNRDPGYYDAIIKAKRAFNSGHFSAVEESLEWGQKALAISPTSTEAKGVIATALTVLASMSKYPAEETYARALGYADEIRSAVGATVESELTRGFIALYYDRDLRKAEEAFDLALEIAPGNSLAHAWRASLLAVKGDVTGAARETDIAVKLDPLSMMIVSDRCWLLRAARRNEEAVDACTWLREMNPEGYMSAIWLASSLEVVGRETDAAPILDELLMKARSWPEAAPLPDDAFADRELTDLQQRYCETAWRMQALPEKYRFPYYFVATMWARCGDYERSADALRDAKSRGELWALFYYIDPMFDAFRNSALASTVDMEIKVRESI